MQANYVPHISDDGQVVGYFVLIIDDSAHKRAKDVQTLLTEATALLSSSLDYETTLAMCAPWQCRASQIGAAST